MNHMTRKFRFLLFAGLILAAFVAALPAAAAPGGTIVNYALNAADCYVDITVQVQDAGFYAINMWDDGAFRAGAGAQVGAGETLTVRFVIGGVILQGAAGIGVYLEDGVGTAATSTYASSGSVDLWSDVVGSACAATHTWSAAVAPGACANPLPSGTPIYNVPAGALAFYDDDVSAYAGFNLPAGTWYITDFGEAFAQVWIDCNAQPIYIPVENVVR
ncbi:MAG: hypothetical protein IPO91_09050 [Chloroflexi bacterium]|nr:hypothetical protein [Chloroflexota bacterium]